MSHKGSQRIKFSHSVVDPVGLAGQRKGKVSGNDLHSWEQPEHDRSSHTEKGALGWRGKWEGHFRKGQSWQRLAAIWEEQGPLEKLDLHIRLTRYLAEQPQRWNLHYYVFSCFLAGNPGPKEPPKMTELCVPLSSPELTNPVLRGTLRRSRPSPTTKETHKSHHTDVPRFPRWG